MKTRMTIIAAAVVMLFAGGQMALAAQKQLHEDEWGKVNLYGNTTIAGDSVDDWGPWKEFVQPAAGEPSVALLGGLGGSLYTPLAQVTQEGCPAGAACGYAVFKNFVATEGYGRRGSYWYYDYPDEGGDKKFGVFPATFTVYPEFGEQSKWGGDLSGSFELAKMNPSDPNPNFTESGIVDGWYLYNPFFGGFGKADGYDENSGVHASIEGKVDNMMYTHGEGWQPSAVAVGGDGGWHGSVDPGFKIYVYVTGQQELLDTFDGGEGYQPNQKLGVLGAYVVGVPTSAADMAAMNTLKACYSGNEVLSGAKVHIGVNFNNATWNGTWNGSYSLPEWGASGTITGANITSNAFTGAAQNGLVQGTFYGSGAQNLAGVADVQLQNNISVNTMTMVAPQPFRHVDLFVTEQKYVGPANYQPPE